MTQKNLSEGLLEVKVRDYRLDSATMPKKARILSKLFAKSLGKSAGKVISVYNNIYSQIRDNRSLEDIKESVRREVNRKSKVYVKVPFLKPKQARICGLVAMNYSGFFDSEIELYSALMSDLRTGTVLIENIVEQSKQAAIANPQRYGNLLQKKQQAVYDFGVLMGLVNDDEQFDKLKEGMHDDIAKYFDMVVSMHKGGRLGFSWPLPLKKFSKPIRDGLYNDTVTHAIQEGVGNDYGFVCPEEGAYDLIIKQVKETVRGISSKRIPLMRKCDMAKSLPTTLYFLSGVNAYANGTTDEIRRAVKSDAIGAGLTASTTAYTTADDIDDFVTTWFTTFTTLI